MGELVCMMLLGENSLVVRFYETNGSHGCINLPVDVAREIYEHVAAGMPVICYYE